MYTIIKTLDGGYTCECRYQDGIERCGKYYTIKDAVNRMKDLAKAFNNDTIKKSDIKFLQEKRVETVTIELTPLQV